MVCTCLTIFLTGTFHKHNERGGLFFSSFSSLVRKPLMLGGHYDPVSKGLFNVLCVVTNAPPIFVGRARRGIAPNVLNLILVGMQLCRSRHNIVILLYLYELPMLTAFLKGTQSFLFL